MKFVALATVVGLVSSLIFMNIINSATSEEVAFQSPKNMKVAKAGDDVYIVFEAMNTNSTKEDIFLSASHDGGKNYSTINLSNGRVLLKSSQDNKPSPVDKSFNPQIAIDKEGDVYVAWNAANIENNKLAVLASSEDKFASPIVPFVNMTDEGQEADDLTLINDASSGAVNLYYLTNSTGPADPCKTRCG